MRFEYLKENADPFIDFKLPDTFVENLNVCGM